MYVEIVPNRSSRPAILLREGWREGSKVRKRTLANISSWPQPKIDALRKLLRNQPLVSPDQVFSIASSLPHGHVELVLAVLRRLRLPALLDRRPSRQRDCVLAMVAQRLLHPASRFADPCLWRTSTLASEFALLDADEDDLLDAMDWLRQRQQRIQQRLARRHLDEGAQVLVDVSSGYCGSLACTLPQFGSRRNGQGGCPIAVHGVLTDRRGRPLALQACSGDPVTLPDQVETLRNRCGLRRLVLVGDRDILTDASIQTLRQYPGLGWIAALSSDAIRQLADAKSVQMSLSEQCGPAAIRSPQYPDERLVVGRDPALAAFDGLYVIRTSETDLSARDVVHSYRNLVRVERAFRCRGIVDSPGRPIDHRCAEPVRAHLFACLLSDYVEWYLRQALAPLLFGEEELEERSAQSDPVATAEPTEPAPAKKNRRTTADGLERHSLATLLQALATRSRHQCRLQGDSRERTVEMLTEPTPLQEQALELVRSFPVDETSDR